MEQLSAHAPALQTSPTPQARPQAPQCVGSVAVLTHSPPHAVLPGGQAQAPSRQRRSVSHAWAQAPQFSPSDESETQRPPQHVVPAEHDVAQPASERPPSGVPRCEPDSLATPESTRAGSPIATNDDSPHAGSARTQSQRKARLTMPLRARRERRATAGRRSRPFDPRTRCPASTRANTYRGR